MEQVLQAIQLKRELDLLRPIEPETEARIMQKFRLDWNYHSNKLEGNSLSYGETKALILFGLTAQGKPLKDHFEITGHDEAIKEILEVVQQKRSLTENFIRELHTLILKQPYEVDAITPDGRPTRKKIQVGVYKSTPNHVRTRTGEIFRFASPEETPAKMHDLIEWYRTKMEQKEVEPIFLASEFHYKFIRIHPFDDGNGRTVRLLMNFILMQFGYPPVIIKTEDKENYFLALQQADAGLMEPFIEYVSENLVRSLKIMIKGAKGESIEEPDDLDKEVALLDRKLEMLTNKNTNNGFSEKTDERTLQAYDENVNRLAKCLVDRSKVFAKHYLTSEFSIKIHTLDNISYFSTNPTIAGRKLINKFTRSIALIYQFNTIKIDQLPISSFSSIINMEFSETGYSVHDFAKEAIFEKKYEDSLTEEEVDALVKIEIRRHKEFIEGQME